MTIVLTDSANYTAIADAIREKGGFGSSTILKPSQMAAVIGALPSGGSSETLPCTYVDEDHLRFVRTKNGDPRCAVLSLSAGGDIDWEYDYIGSGVFVMENGEPLMGSYMLMNNGSQLYPSSGGSALLTLAGAGAESSINTEYIGRFLADTGANQGQYSITLFYA